MKTTRASNRLFFITLLCLLWLPNYCDIKENEGDSQTIQINKVVSSVSREIENIPSQQEKEKYDEALAIPVVKLPVEPNVDYVNSVENKKIDIDIDEVINTQHGQSSEEVAQQVFSNLESSRPKTIEVKERTPVLHRNVEQKSDEPIEIIGVPSINQPDLIKPSLSAPVSETSKPPSEEPKTATVTSTVESPQLEKKEEQTERPVIIPLSPASEKPVLEGIHQQPHYDGMPSFDEWKKMMLAEQEKGGQKIPSPTPPGKKISSQKRRRNYSSYECGAKIVASNTESEGTGRILNELVDEYMLNPCKAKIWFVIELCETVQATQIELANFELFSSCPREFAVYSSDNFPTRDWVMLGTFTAAELRVLQSFELKQEGFGKFVKIELLSYYGKEHYCPLSVVRIFGTSMVDEYEEMETLASQPPVSEDDLDRLDISMEDKKSSNIFNSATDAVMNIVKKAAQVLGQHQSIDDGPINDTRPDQQNASEAKLCKTMDNSSNKCEDVPIRTTNKNDNHLPSLHNFSISPSSLHHSLFRLLHRCDQCSLQRVRYYSSAQPHCRFFQAAFGTAVLQGLCDWLKDHPTHESSAHRKDPISVTGPQVTAPTKSPPPQIMIVPLDDGNKTENATSMEPSHDNDVVVNATKTSVDVVLESGTDSVHLDPSIQPTHQEDHSVPLNESQKAVPEFSDVVLPSADTINHLSKRPIIIVSEGTNISTDKSTPDMEVIPPDNDPPPTVESIPADTEDEFIPDSVELADDLSLAEDLKAVTTEDLSLPKVIPTEDLSLPKAVPTEDLSLPRVVPTEDLTLPRVVPSIARPGEPEFRLEPVPVATAGQKESVFMRMSNRIKALELNMSLSSQYLQELSQRYRRQMEDMQRAFNRTIGTLNDTARKAAERDLRQQEILNTLQLQVSNLTQTVEILLNERSSVYREMIETHVCILTIEVIIMITVLSLFVRRLSPPAAPTYSPLQQGSTISDAHRPSSVATPRLSKRRSSADSCTPPVARKVKRRAASEEALHAGEELLIIEPSTAFLEPIRAKKKNRKRSRVLRSVSNPTAPQQRNPSPTTSQCAPLPSLSHSDGCMQKNPNRSKHQLHRKNHPCENCCRDSYSCTEAREKRRPNGTAPLQNLTNGSIPGSQDTSTKNQRLPKGERKFSFRKFLRFQKRDSI